MALCVGKMIKASNRGSFRNSKNCRIARKYNLPSTYSTEVEANSNMYEAAITNYRKIMDTYQNCISKHLTGFSQNYVSENDVRDISKLNPQVTMKFRNKYLYYNV